MRKKSQAKRYRLRFSFWLNILNPDEERIADVCELLKNQRLFARACRDGIMLFIELQQGTTDFLTQLFAWLQAPIELYRQLCEGRVDLLVELFPWVKDAFTPPPPSNDDLRREIDFLKQLILTQRTGAAESTAAPRPLAVAKTAPPPIDNDDDIDLVVTPDTSTSSSENFLKSAFALQGIALKS